ncbi:hypothetical protein ES703_26819 [subsurface metagenome]
MFWWAVGAVARAFLLALPVFLFFFVAWRRMGRPLYFFESDLSLRGPP